MDKMSLDKMQHKFWVKKQTVFRKLGKKEDDCIVASDAELDAKLELFKSIQKTSNTMLKLLDRFQEKICYLAQEQNEMGRFLKEYGKADKTMAGKMMIQTGKTLIYTSQQEIGLRPPLVRLYQEVETFQTRAVKDTLETIVHMEKTRTEYRASLSWMKNISQELDPDTNRQMEKFRKVQYHVKDSKNHFDKLKLACLQKVDLLAAARCNMFSHALIQYQNALTKISNKNKKVFRTLGNTYQGYQHYEFSFVKELVEPSRQVVQQENSVEPTEQSKEAILFDFNDENDPKEARRNGEEGERKMDSKGQQLEHSSSQRSGEKIIAEAMDSCQLLESLLSMDSPGESFLGIATKNEEKSPTQIPEPEKNHDLLGIDLLADLSLKNVKNEEPKDVMDLLTSDEFDTKSFEDNTMSLLNELLGDGPVAKEPQAAKPNKSVGSANLFSNFGASFAAKNTESKDVSKAPTISSQGLLTSAAETPKLPSSAAFLPSQLLNFDSIDSQSDLLNLKEDAAKSTKKSEETSSFSKSWYDIFADIDPIANPDGLIQKNEDNKDEDKRYC